MDFIFIFQEFFKFISLLKNRKKFFINHAGLTKMTWCGAHTWQRHADTHKHLCGAKSDWAGVWWAHELVGPSNLGATN